MPTNAIIAVVIALAVIGGGYFALRPSVSVPEYAAEEGAAVPPATDNAANASGEGESVGVSVSTPVVVTLTESGFSPKSVTVKAGQAVTFVNQSKGGMWVGSDEHPTHTEYGGTSRSQHCPDTDGAAFDQCTVGNQYSFTFTKAGTWGYHNHVSAQAEGTVIVIP